jgi:hypothetical protein
MSVVSAASAAVAANHALNAQAMKMAAVKQRNEAAQSVIKMLEAAIDPAAGADKTKAVDFKV